MTECERLVQEGRISEDFFREEVRNDFLVDVERKKIWAIELDLLSELDRVCKKHGLKYFLWAGSLLGAVRHQGFIPWDDDMDVAMLRDDYDKLKELTYEFSHPYFLQYPHTDPQAGYSHLKIRNSNTTAFNKIWGFRSYNFGIYIDIFPMDNFFEEGQKERNRKIEELNVDSSLYMKMPSPYINDWDKYRMKNYSGRTIVENFDEIERLATMYRDVPSDCGIRATSGSLRFDKIVWPYEYISETVDLPYEDRSFPAPIAYIKCLEQAFGDWRQFPPVEKRVNKHGHTIFEPDIPFAQYQKPPFEPYMEYLEYGRKKMEEERQRIAQQNGGQ